MEVSKWRDGSDMICDVCHEPIYTTQPLRATTTHVAKKRHCRHFMCSPNASITIIGNGGTSVFKGGKE